MAEEDVVRLEEQVKTLFATCGRLESAIDSINKKLATWLPPWATALIALLTALVGYYVKT